MCIYERGCRAPEECDCSGVYMRGCMYIRGWVYARVCEYKRGTCKIRCVYIREGVRHLSRVTAVACPCVVNDVSTPAISALW